MELSASVEHRSMRQSRPRSVEKTRVLVVEDESDIAGLITHTLERSGDAIVELRQAAIRR